MRSAMGMMLDSTERVMKNQKMPLKVNRTSSYDLDAELQ